MGGSIQLIGTFLTASSSLKLKRDPPEKFLHPGKVCVTGRPWFLLRGLLVPVTGVPVVPVTKFLLRPRGSCYAFSSTKGWGLGFRPQCDVIIWLITGIRVPVCTACRQASSKFLGTHAKGSIQLHIIYLYYRNRMH